MQEPMYRWIIKYACYLKAPPLQPLWPLRQQVVSALRDHGRSRRFWCERPVRIPGSVRCQPLPQRHTSDNASPPWARPAEAGSGRRCGNCRRSRHTAGAGPPHLPVHTSGRGTDQSGVRATGDTRITTTCVETKRSWSVNAKHKSLSQS